MDGTDMAARVFMAISFVLLWNSGFVGAEFGLPDSGPFTLLFWRYAALTGFLAVPVLIRGGLHGIPAVLILRSAVIGILSHGVWLGCVLVSLDLGVAAGIVALVVALQPLATGALSSKIAGEVTTPRQWLGLGLGLAGVAIAVGARVRLTEGPTVFAYMVPFGSVVAITIASLLHRRFRHDSREARLYVDTQLLIQAAATTLVVAAPAIFAEGLQTDWSSQYLATQAWLTFAVSLGAYALMWMLLARMEATKVASLFYLGPPVTMLMAWIALGDTLIMTDGIGLLVVAFGVALVWIRARRRTA